MTEDQKKMTFNFNRIPYEVVKGQGNCDYVGIGVGSDFEGASICLLQLTSCPFSDRSRYACPASDLPIYVAKQITKHYHDKKESKLMAEQEAIYEKFEENDQEEKMVDSLLDSLETKVGSDHGDAHDPRLAK